MCTLHMQEKKESEKEEKCMEKSENALPCYCEMNNFCFFFFFLCTNSNQPASPKQPLYYFFLDCCPLFLTCLSLSHSCACLATIQFCTFTAFNSFSLSHSHRQPFLFFFYNFLSSALTAAFSPFCCHSPML